MRLSIVLIIILIGTIFAQDAVVVDNVKAPVQDGFFISMQKDIKKLIRKAIQNAESEIDVVMYKFEDTDIASDIEERAKAGIKVSFIVDETENGGKNSLVNQLEKASKNVNVKFINNKLHAKFAIIDKSILLVGSCNWSEGFDENDEDIIVTRDVSLVANSNAAFALLADSTKNN